MKFELGAKYSAKDKIKGNRVTVQDINRTTELVLKYVGTEQQRFGLMHVYTVVGVQETKPKPYRPVRPVGLHYAVDTELPPPERCRAGIHSTLRVVGKGEVIHRWRQCKRAPIVSIVSPGSRYHQEPLCRQHWDAVVRRAGP